MSQTATQQKHLRDLSRRIEEARSSVAQLAVVRETAIREHGIAHPHTIDATRRLNRTQTAHRRMSGAYAVALGADARASGHQRVP